MNLVCMGNWYHNIIYYDNSVNSIVWYIDVIEWIRETNILHATMFSGHCWQSEDIEYD